MTHPQDLANAARRVAEYVRQRDITMSGGNVGDVITTIHADPEVGSADLDVGDLRTLLSGVPTWARGATRIYAIQDQLHQAVYDPGSIAGRRLSPSWGEGQPGYADEQESLWDWAVRALLCVLQPDAQADPPRVTVYDTDWAHVTAPNGDLLADLNYEQLLVFQERIEDAVAEMSVGSFSPSAVKRPRKGETI